MVFFKNVFNFLKSLLIIILITFLFSLLIDFFYGKKILIKLDPFLSKTQFYERLVRIDHKIYHHTLRENVEYNKMPGFDGNHTFCTDNHGFKYKCKKNRDKKFNIGFLGDSFVEGLGLDYEKTFVGIFENEKNISVANLGSTSYATKIYLSKMKYLLDNNYFFDHIILFIDISDLYDDNVFYKLNNDYSVNVRNFNSKRLKKKKFLRNNFPLTNYYMYVIKMTSFKKKDDDPERNDKPFFYEKSLLKAKWTYSKKDIISGYLHPISKTQKEMIQNIEKLHNLLSEKNIKLSIVVYPWPQQLENNDVNSKHVKMWKNFCENKCYKFIDLFPFFFKEIKKTSYLEVYKKYYFWNDVHFNYEGNKVIAKRLIEEFQK